MVSGGSQPVEFSVVYDGEALTDNTMDVKDLAPALLSLGQAFDRANSLLNADRADINLQIKAISPGSFDISLLLSQIVPTAGNALSTDWLKSAETLKELIIGTPTGAIGLLMLIKKLKGQKPKQTSTPDGIIFEADKVRLVVPSDVARLFNDRHERDQVEGVIRPLRKKGITKVVFKQGKQELETVTSDEMPYFEAGSDKDNVTEYLIPRQRLQIDSLTFKQGKWKLNDGGNSHWYSMDDKDFATAIEKGKAFGKFDILLCEVIMTQQMKPDGQLRLDYSVKKVIRHVSNPSQQLPMDEPKES